MSKQRDIIFLVNICNTWWYRLILREREWGGNRGWPGGEEKARKWRERKSVKQKWKTRKRGGKQVPGGGREERQGRYSETKGEQGRKSPLCSEVWARVLCALCFRNFNSDFQTLPHPAWYHFSRLDCMCHVFTLLPQILALQQGLPQPSKPDSLPGSIPASL